MKDINASDRRFGSFNFRENSILWLFIVIATI
jgi:hypothetical protein